jgi:hypothetical protein
VRTGVTDKVQEGASVSTAVVCGGIHGDGSAMRTMVDP